MSKYFDESARERMQLLKDDIVDYQKEVESDKLEFITARENLRKSEVRWAEAIIALDKFKEEYGL